MVILVICLLIEKIITFIADTKNVKFLTQFYLGSVSGEFSTTESREVSLNRNVWEISVHCNSIDKSDTLNTHNYLMTKNSIK